MNKKVTIIVLVVLLLVGVGVAYLLTANKPVNEANSSNLLKQASSETQTQPAESPQAEGKYITYSAEALSTATGKRILYFHAPWCPQCQELDASIKKGPIPDGVTIIRTDFDSNQELRKKYGVTQQTTLVLIDENGNLVKKYNAYDSPTLSSITDNLL
jgi:thiol-disulfide isomerase/thioredoxin